MSKLNYADVWKRHVREKFSDIICMSIRVYWRFTEQSAGSHKVCARPV